MWYDAASGLTASIRCHQVESTNLRGSIPLLLDDAPGLNELKVLSSPETGDDEEDDEC